MFKKSQAAMEFLMTYGWAILVVLVAVGALAYFGVLTPEQFLPNRCTLPSGIGCIDHKADSSGVTVVLRNGMGYDMSDVSVKFTDKAAGAPCSGTATPGGAGTNLLNGDKQTFTYACTPSGSKFNADLNVTYMLSDTGLTHTSKGSIITKIE